MQNRFPIAYWGSIGYFQKLVDAKTVRFEINEQYIKQTLRNRVYILGPNKVLPLSIPVVKVNGSKTLMKDILIARHQNWEKGHLKAFETAYSSSPYYEHYLHDILPIYEASFEKLIDFNMTQIQFIKNSLDLPFDISFSESYDLSENEQDFRTISETPSQEILYQYHQVFQENNPSFIGNLSILDALFNLGPMTRQLIVK